MKFIGLCGGSGSGKGVVSSLFASRGIPNIDTDAIYRQIISGDSLCTRALSDEFGKKIISQDGSVNRRVLADIVFSSENSDYKLKRLNSIAHTFILDETRKRLDELKTLGFEAAIVDAPVLFESGFDKECDGVLCVYAPREVRIARIMERDSISREQAERRIDAQASDAYLLSRSGYHICNEGDVEALRARVAEIAQKIKCEA